MTLCRYRFQKPLWKTVFKSLRFYQRFRSFRWAKTDNKLPVSKRRDITVVGENRAICSFTHRTWSLSRAGLLWGAALISSSITCSFLFFTQQENKHLWQHRVHDGEVRGQLGGAGCGENRAADRREEENRCTFGKDAAEVSWCLLLCPAIASCVIRWCDEGVHCMSYHIWL